MTKKQLIEALSDFPDSIEVRMNTKIIVAPESEARVLNFPIPIEDVVANKVGSMSRTDREMQVIDIAMLT